MGLQWTEHGRHIPKSLQLKRTTLLERECRPARPFGRCVAEDIPKDRRHQSRRAIDRRAEDHKLPPSQAAHDAKQRIACRHADRDGESQSRNGDAYGAGGIDGTLWVVTVKRTPRTECGHEYQAFVVEKQLTRRSASPSQDLLE
ncbi:hypothetical protein MesoLj131c_31080 [Mesorhizobium sp. 131-3-5]|nr:hypothetical protein MesoLj131c_31080 [Mesorhizobium sp. 131-3-5]